MTSTITPRGNKIDNVVLTAYAFRQKPISLLPYLEGISWQEDTEQAAISANITLHDIGEKFFKTYCRPGTWIRVNFVNPATEKLTTPLELYVWESENTDRIQARIEMDCFDVSSFLMRSGRRPDWVFRNKTAYEIAKSVLDDTDFKYELVKTTARIPYLHFTNLYPLEVIISAYTEDRRITSQFYRIRTIGRKFTVSRLLSQRTTWEFSEGTNLEGAVWRESLAETFTDIRAVMVSPDTRVQTRIARATSPSINQYGRITEQIQYAQGYVSPKRLKDLAKIRLRDKKKLQQVATIEAGGVPMIRATDAVILRDSGTGIRGKLFVSRVDHSISNGSHTMSMELVKEPEVPLRPVSDEERQEQDLGPDLEIGPDGLPIIPGGTAGTYTGTLEELRVKITDTSADEFQKTPLTGLHPNIQQFAFDLMRATPGNQYIISALRPGSTVAGTGKVSFHSYGLAVDIAAADLRNARLTTATSPSLDFLAALARTAMGHELNPGDGASQNEIGTVIWKTMVGGNHYDHVHIDLRSSNIPSPILPQPGSRVLSRPGTIPSSASTGADGLSREQITSLRAIYKAFSAKNIDPYAGAAVSYRESGWDPEALGDAGCSYGLFQLNRCGGAINGMSAAEAVKYFDPDLCAEFVANALVRMGGFVGQVGAEVARQITIRFERPANKEAKAAQDAAFYPRARDLMNIALGGGGSG